MKALDLPPQVHLRFDAYDVFRLHHLAPFGQEPSIPDLAGYVIATWELNIEEADEGYSVNAVMREGGLTLYSAGGSELMSLDQVEPLARIQIDAPDEDDQQIWRVSVYTPKNRQPSEAPDDIFTSFVSLSIYHFWPDLMESIERATIGSGGEEAWVGVSWDSRLALDANEVLFTTFSAERASIEGHALQHSRTQATMLPIFDPRYMSLMTGIEMDTARPHQFCTGEARNEHKISARPPVPTGADDALSILLYGQCESCRAKTARINRFTPKV